MSVVILDGTLVDTNSRHALAWYRAFRRHGIALPIWLIHRHIGMGGEMTGGLSEEELRRAGAVEVYESVAELRSALERIVVPNNRVGS